MGQGQTLAKQYIIISLIGLQKNTGIMYLFSYKIIHYYHIGVLRIEYQEDMLKLQ